MDTGLINVVDHRGFNNAILYNRKTSNPGIPMYLRISEFMKLRFLLFFVSYHHKILIKAYMSMKRNLLLGWRVRCVSKAGKHDHVHKSKIYKSIKKKWTSGMTWAHSVWCLSQLTLWRSQFGVLCYMAGCRSLSHQASFVYILDEPDGFRMWTSNHTHIFMWPVITHPEPDISNLTKLRLMLRHGK